MSANIYIYIQKLNFAIKFFIFVNMINLFERFLFSEKYQKFAKWSFRGNFFQVWLKWMLISFVIETPLLIFIYYPHTPDWHFVKIVPFINAYTALLPALVGRRLNPKEEKDKLKEQFKKPD